ncbi:MAG: hypothetical protein NUK62_06635 [Tenericutes bacterium]|nr:hypothetical protein [Mycoplasmatota bacterium]
MLTWFGKECKGRTIRLGEKSFYRFIMPFYEEWKKLMLKDPETLKLLLDEEYKYIKRKVDEEWFVIYNTRKGYLLLDNRTGGYTYTKEPLFFIDSRIPIDEIPQILKIFGYKKLAIQDEIIEHSIAKAFAFLEGNNE